MPKLVVKKSSPSPQAPDKTPNPPLPGPNSLALSLETSPTSSMRELKPGNRQNLKIREASHGIAASNSESSKPAKISSKPPASSKKTSSSSNETPKSTKTAKTSSSEKPSINSFEIPFSTKMSKKSLRKAAKAVGTPVKSGLDSLTSPFSESTSKSLHIPSSKASFPENEEPSHMDYLKEFNGKPPPSPFSPNRYDALSDHEDSVEYDLDIESQLEETEEDKAAEYHEHSEDESDTSSDPIRSYSGTIPCISPSPSSSYSFSSDDLFHQKGSSFISTNLLLISRIPSNYSINQITDDLLAIESLLGGPSLDISDFVARYEAQPEKFYLTKYGNRLGIVAILKESADFSTTGTFNSPVLPMFFFSVKTNDIPPFAGTSKRLTVQAIPSTFSTESHCPSLNFDLATIRGIPDNAHSASTVLGLILHDLRVTLGQLDSILPLFVTVRTTRYPRNSVRRDEPLWIEEIFLRLYALTQDDLLSCQLSLHLQPTPIPYTALAWKGQMARTLEEYYQAPTNVPDLVYSPMGLLFFGLTDSLEFYYNLFCDYISPNTPISFGVLYQGAMDSPWLQVTTDAIFIMSSLDGVSPAFDSERWNMEQPIRYRYSATYLPGYSAIMTIYEHDPNPSSVRRARVLPTVQGGVLLPDLRISNRRLLQATAPIANTSAPTFGRSNNTRYVNPNRQTQMQPYIPPPNPAPPPSLPLNYSNAVVNAAPSPSQNSSFSPQQLTELTALLVANNTTQQNFFLAALREDREIQRAMLDMRHPQQSMVTSFARPPSQSLSPSSLSTPTAALSTARRPSSSIQDEPAHQ